MLEFLSLIACFLIYYELGIFSRQMAFTIDFRYALQSKPTTERWSPSLSIMDFD